MTKRMSLEHKVAVVNLTKIIAHEMGCRIRAAESTVGISHSTYLKYLRDLAQAYDRIKGLSQESADAGRVIIPGHYRYGELLDALCRVLSERNSLAKQLNAFDGKKRPIYMTPVDEMEAYRQKLARWASPDEKEKKGA